MVFQKRFSPETDDVFQELKNIRKTRCISLENINRRTKIPLKYLKALEDGSINELPDILYIINIIKKYLAFFDIDAKPYLARLEIKKEGKLYPKRIINSGPLIVMPRVIKAVLAIALVLGFVGFLGYKINGIFSPPSIIIYTPAEGASTGSKTIDVRGRTEKDTTLFINGEQIVLDKNGEFEKEINLQKGLNLIKISGVRKYSKENIIWRNVVLEIKE